jgi:hypothetical protein
MFFNNSKICFYTRAKSGWSKTSDLICFYRYTFSSFSAPDALYFVRNMKNISLVLNIEDFGIEVANRLR